MRMLILVISLLFSFQAVAVECKHEREKMRAYIIDDTNGTRSGPIRCLTSQAIMNKLKADKKKLEDHAQGEFSKSGFAKPGETSWTDLPADSIFK